MPTASEQVFSFIYWLENHPVYYPKVEQYIMRVTSDDSQLVTSVLTYMEYSIKPEELGRRDLIEDFLNLTTALNCPLMPITVDITKKAFQLRATYKSLKAMDALQLATALVMKCQVFITNDKRLRGIPGLTILIIDEIAG